MEYGGGWGQNWGGGEEWGREGGHFFVCMLNSKIRHVETGRNLFPTCCFGVVVEFLFFSLDRDRCSPRQFSTYL